MSWNKSSFSFLNEDFQSTMSFEDYSMVKMMEKCDIKIKIKSYFVETISNELHVFYLKNNLLSVGQLQENNL